MCRGRCSTICRALVFVGTRLNQKSDNFKLPILSCYEKRCWSILCPALVFVGTRLNQKSDNFTVPLLSSNEKRRCSIICPALVFVGTGLDQQSDNFTVPPLSSNQKRRYSIVCQAFVFVGTGLNQKSDNFTVPLLSSNDKRRCSIICPALVFVGTGLNQQPDNFKVPLISSHQKRRCSIICPALVFVGTGPQPAIGQLQGALCEQQVKEAWIQCLLGLCLCWHPTQPAIEQLQGAPHKQPSKEALLHRVHCLSRFGLCWHPTQPAIGQLQAAPFEQQWKEALLHCLSGLCLCWHRTQPAIGQLHSAPAEQQSKEALLHPVHCLSRFGLCWHPDSTSNRTTSSFPFWAAMKRGVSPSLQPWVFVGTSFKQEKYAFETSIGGCRIKGRELICILKIRTSWLVQLLLKQCAIILAACHNDFAILFGIRRQRTPLSQGVQLVGSRFDHHPAGSCREGAVVGIVGRQSPAPSAVLVPLLRTSANSSSSNTAIDSPVNAESTSSMGLRGRHLKSNAWLSWNLKYLEPKACCLRIWDLQNIIHFRKTKSSPPRHYSRAAETNVATETFGSSRLWWAFVLHLSEFPPWVSPVCPIRFGIRFPSDKKACHQWETTLEVVQLLPLMLGATLGDRYVKSFWFRTIENNATSAAFFTWLFD